MAELPRRRRLLIGAAALGVAAAFTFGGVAYALGGDGSGEPSYVQIVEDPNTTTTDGSEAGPRDGTAPDGTRDWDCPDKQGGGQGGDQGGGQGNQPDEPSQDAAGRV